tara:strand:- start:22878 stop:23729 length:852 start_codon:yes stop_codon:yes gene_type:complete
LAEHGAPFSTAPLPAGSRIACRIEYNGRRYSGWQAQPHLTVKTVQEELEAALCTIADAPVRVQCAGRTDSGVHGYSQIIHFDAPTPRSAKAWVVGTNAKLPFDIRVHWAAVVPEDFHARFSATARRYRYLIYNNPVRPALLHALVTWVRYPLDAALMHEAAQSLLGERDFSAFRAASCQSHSSMRNVQDVSVRRCHDWIIVDIKANAFLHHMVRNIVGSLMAVGEGREPAAWIAQLLERADRTLAAETAPADGLYLVEVEYPSAFALPAVPPGPQIVAALMAG